MKTHKFKREEVRPRQIKIKENIYAFLHITPSYISQQFVETIIGKHLQK